MIKGINHITLAVQDLEREFDFYTRVLGLKPLSKRAGIAAYLLAGETWLALVQESKPVAKNYSHLALSVSSQDLQNLKDKILAYGTLSWQDNQTFGESFYFEDQSGNRLELHTSDLESRLDNMRNLKDSNIEFY